MAFSGNNVGTTTLGFRVVDLSDAAFPANTLNFSTSTTVVVVSSGPPDEDEDGVLDNVDMCLASNLAPTVVIDGCDSGLPNTLLQNPMGCTR